MKKLEFDYQAKEILKEKILPDSKVEIDYNGDELIVK